jgi:hypothetical protein
MKATKIKYLCDRCGAIVESKMTIGLPPESQIPHECGGLLIRQYGERFLDKQEDTVSAASQTMLYSKLPSNKQKAAI